MSNFYNTLAGGYTSLPGTKYMMNITKRCLALGLVVSLLAVPFSRADDPPAPEKSPAASPLEPLAFLIGGEWEAKLPAQPDGKQISILAHFTWANNHRVIRISNVFAVGANSVPYIDGIYAWHPQKQTIVFSYVDSEGNFYEGTVKPEHGGLLHEFLMTDPKGQASQFSARQTQDGTNAWVNEIFSRKDGRLDPMVKVRYEKMK
jgi:hypothetical protein